MIDLEQQLTEHLQRKAEAVTPRFDLDAIVDDNVRSIEFTRRVADRERRPLIGTVIGIAAAAAVLVGFIMTREDDAIIEPATTVAPTTTVAVNPVDLFGGVWLSTDTDGSTQVMDVTFTADGSAQVTVNDDLASMACDGAASVLAGTGRIDSAGDLVFIP